MVGGSVSTKVGCSVGSSVGTRVGTSVGRSVVGRGVGSVVVGSMVGFAVGRTLGSCVGKIVGSTEGSPVGKAVESGSVGTCVVGVKVGILVVGANDVGSKLLGTAMGLAVGTKSSSLKAAGETVLIVPGNPLLPLDKLLELLLDDESETSMIPIPKSTANTANTINSTPVAARIHPFLLPPLFDSW